MKTKTLLILILLISGSTGTNAQIYSADWGHDLFGDELPNGLLIDTAYGFFTYTTTGDSISMQTYAETRSVTSDSKGNSIDVSDFGGFYYEVSPLKKVSLDPHGVVINKRNKQGVLQWKKYIRGALNPKAWSVTTDASDNIFMCGHFSDTLDINPNTQVDSIIRSPGLASDNGFIVKLDSNGNFLWGLNLHASGDLRCYDMALDSANNIYVVGDFKKNADFDPGTGTALDTASGPSENLFVLKLDPQGKYRWHYTTITNKLSRAYTCALDDSAAVYVAGEFQGQEDFSGTGTDTRTAKGNFDAFVFKLDSSGSYQWARNYGTAGQEEIRAIGFDGKNIVIAGLFEGSMNLDTGKTNFTVSTNQSFNSYVQKLDKQGNHVWASKIATGAVMILGMDVNDAGEALLAGRLNTQGIFNLPGGPDTLSNQGGDWLAVGVSSSNQITWAQHWESSGNDWANDITAVGNGQFVIAGTFVDELYPQPRSSQLVYGEGIGYEGLVIKTTKCTVGQTFSASACGSYTSPSGHTWQKSGTYKDTLFYSGICDSVLTFHLTIYGSDTGNLAASDCRFYQTPGGQLLTQTGVYYDTLSTSQGCDSILAINFTRLPGDTGQLSPSVCGSYASPAGKIYTQSGLYYDSLTTTMGCDSLVVINLTILQPSSKTLFETVCQSYTVPSGTQTYFSSGVYYDTLSNSLGCDSVLTINLQVNQPSYDSVKVNSCDDYTFPSGQQTVFTSGIYYDTLTNHTGCDSLVTLDVTINQTPDTSVVLQGDSLVALVDGIQYQWLRCDSGYAVLEGDTNTAYRPTVSGTYALRVAQEGCADTSACRQIDVITGYAEHHLRQIRIYPNPVVGDRVFLDLPSSDRGWELRLFDPLGKELQSITGPDFDSMDLPETPGVYLFLINEIGGEAQAYKVIRYSR